MRRWLAITSALAACWAPGCRQDPGAKAADSAWRQGGEVEWVQTSSGRMKTIAYRGAALPDAPVLVVVLHGDLPKPSYHYTFAKNVAAANGNLVAAAMLRPGYQDPSGDQSSGQMGYYSGDNYTAEVVDDIYGGIEQLRERFHPRSVILVGHSGGAAIAADLIGRHPGPISALLVSCACDPVGLMARLKKRYPKIPPDLPNPSLLPLDLATRVSRAARVRMLAGSNDDVTGPPDTQRYADALKSAGVPVEVTIVPGADHDMLLSPPVYQALSQLIQEAR